MYEPNGMPGVGARRMRPGLPHKGTSKASNLSAISTQWSDICQAKDGSSGAARMALERLITRYEAPIRRYLRACTRDADVVDELFQRFALRLVRGDFRRASPTRGRFRDYLKMALINLVRDHNRQTTRAHVRLPDRFDPFGRPTAGINDEEHARFLTIWRDSLIAHAWARLADFERETGKPLYTIACLEMNSPELRSTDIAERISVPGAPPRTAGWVRKSRQGLRSLFALYLVEEVAASLEVADVDALESELIALELLSYCREALGRFRGGRLQNEPEPRESDANSTVPAGAQSDGTEGPGASVAR